MVVADSSALIPLAWVGRLELIEEQFDEVHTVESVREEVLVEGKRGTSLLASFLEDVELHDAPDDAAEVADLEGIAETDAAVVLLASDRDERLLANDRGLVRVAETHDVEAWWVTTLLLRCAKDGTLSAEEASDVCYELVDAGMNLHPSVYAKVQRALDDLGD